MKSIPKLLLAEAQVSLIIMAKFVPFLALLFLSGAFCQSDIDQLCDDRDDPDMYFLKYPEDCSMYIGCDEPAFIESCGDEYYFNEEEQTCDEKENVQCDNDIEPEPETTTTTTTEAPTTTTTTEAPITEDEVTTSDSNIETEETTEEDRTTDINSTDPPIKEPTTKVAETIECPDGDSSVTFLPSKNSCSEFYACVNGVPIHMECADNLYFNSLKGKCDFKDNVRCSIGVPVCDRTMHKFFPHESSCNLFYYCRYGHLSIQRCSYFYYWNAERNECQLNNGQQC